MEEPIGLLEKCKRFWEKFTDVVSKWDVEKFFSDALNEWDFWQYLIAIVGAALLLIYQIPARLIKKRRAAKDAATLRNTENIGTADPRSITDLFVPTRIIPTELPTYENPKPAIKKDEEKEMITFLIEQLKKEDHKYYLLIADSGMGKTTGLRNLFLAYHRTSYAKKRPLRYFHLSRPQIWQEIEKLENKKQTYLILDAFDEDAAALRDFRGRMEELSRLLTDFDKVIISSRRQIFTTPKDLPTRTGDRDFAKETFHYFKIFEIQAFDKKDRNAYLSKCFPYNNPFSFFQNYKKRKEAKAIEGRLDQLMARPLILSFIKELLNEDRSFATVSEIFKAIIDKWAVRERDKLDVHERFKTEEAFKTAHYTFHKDVALQMYNTRDEKKGYYIHKDEKLNTNSSLHLADLISENESEKDQLSLVESNARHRSLLTRTGEDYSFFHPSLMEWFLVEKIKTNYEFLTEKLKFDTLDAGLVFLEEFFNQQLKDQPDNYQMLHGKALVHYTKNDTQLAIPLFEKALTLNQNNPYLYFHLGRLYHFDKDHIKALPLFEQAELLDCKEADNYFYLGIAYFFQKNYEQAIAQYENAIAIKPDKHEAFNNMGNAYADQEKYEQAIAQYEKAIAIKPDYHTAFYKMGIAYAKQGKYEQAIAQYEKAISIYDKDFDAWSELGWNALLLHQYQKSRRAFLKIWNEQTEVLKYSTPMNLGHICLLEKDRAEAMKWYREAIGKCKEEATFQEFITGMREDYSDLKMDEYGISESDYRDVIEVLEREWKR